MSWRAALRDAWQNPDPGVVSWRWACALVLGFDAVLAVALVVKSSVA